MVYEIKSFLIIIECNPNSCSVAIASLSLSFSAEAKVDNTLRDLHNSSDPTKAKSNNYYY